MSQEHAISLLPRAQPAARAQPRRRGQGHVDGQICVVSSFLLSPNEDKQLAKRMRSLSCRALSLLHVPSHAGGVKAMWMDKYVWYEEYPTTPPLFVLNGFIYTLLGLYDLHITEGENSISLAKTMFDDGMISLKTLLPLFDTGSGSFYDLRHFTLGVSPNIARWDYHATHVNQLYLLAGLDDDPIILNTAKRWEGYMQGKKAAHN
ncbi:unnamed protein product [Plutella xylostella]|uniref:(diamondback moth) hypothetical protein n=1 Tax=Plutella xylostella TaxID=51655 RepID=A0A8S4DA00_PLUXY|nr:unnamed protein product [Plutella xylostella]